LPATIPDPFPLGGGVVSGPREQVRLAWILTAASFVIFSNRLRGLGEGSLEGGVDGRTREAPPVARSPSDDRQGRAAGTGSEEAWA